MRNMKGVSTRHKASGLLSNAGFLQQMTEVTRCCCLPAQTAVNSLFLLRRNCWVHFDPVCVSGPPESVRLGLVYSFALNEPFGDPERK